MKKKLLRYFLALFLCGITTNSTAKSILNENFNSCTSGNTPNIEGWEFKYCRGISTGIWTTAILSIEKENNTGSKKGYAKTPIINFVGNSTLSFKAAAKTSGTSSISISVCNGTINGVESCEVSASSQTLENKTFNLSLQQNAQITFSLLTDVYFAIDDIVITPVDITIDEAINNNKTIAGSDEMTMNVKTVRTLLENIWNTMCLPFAVNKATLAEAWETSVELRTYSGYSNNTMSFSSAESVTAGTPFLIKVGKTITNPTFESVTISNAADTIINHDGVKFIGTYSGRDLNTDGTHLFITTTGTVAKPLDDSHNHLKGLRAYIDLTDCPSPVRLNIDGETTDIQQVAIDEERPDALYDLKGQRLQSPKKGIIIKDGKLIFTK